MGEGTRRELEVLTPGASDWEADDGSGPGRGTPGAAPAAGGSRQRPSGRSGAGGSGASGTRAGGTGAGGSEGPGSGSARSRTHGWSEGEAASGSVPRTRWPAVVLVMVLVVVAVTIPLRQLRDRVARHELRWLEGQWAQSLADDGGRITAEQRLVSYRVVTDGARVQAALAATYREEQRRLGAAGHRVHAAVLVDVGLTRLRHDLDSALHHRAALLAGVAAWYEHPSGGAPPPNADNRTARDAVTVDNDIRSQRVRWADTNDSKAPSSPVVAGYRAADAAVEDLSRWLDQPTKSVLLSGSGSSNEILRLDVDASRTEPTGVSAVEAYVTLRQGYLAYVSGSQVWAVAPDGSGTPRPLATGAYLFAGHNPAAVWVVDGDTAMATEIDGTGRILAGPVLPPGGLFVDTAAGLVVFRSHGPAGIEIWNPADGRFHCPNLVNRGDGGPYAIGAEGNSLAWSSGDGELHLTDVTTCQDHLTGVHGLNGTGFPPVGTFSPDGRTFAVATAQTDSQNDYGFPLELVDVASGRVTTVPVAHALSAPISAIAWTPDGSRLFWVNSGVSGSSSIVATWRIGDSAAQALRVVGLALNFPLYVVP